MADKIEHGEGFIRHHGISVVSGPIGIKLEDGRMIAAMHSQTSEVQVGVEEIGDNHVVLILSRPPLGLFLALSKSHALDYAQAIINAADSIPGGNS